MAPIIGSDSAADSAGATTPRARGSGTPGPAGMAVEGTSGNAVVSSVITSVAAVFEIRVFLPSPVGYLP